jgi:hypothetical protein
MYPTGSTCQKSKITHLAYKHSQFVPTQPPSQIWKNNIGDEHRQAYFALIVNKHLCKRP